MSEPINCSPSELSTFLQGLAAESSPTSSSGTGRSARSKSARTARRSSGNGSRTGSSRSSRSTRTSVNSTDGLGADSWTSSPEDSPANPSARPPEGEPSQSTSGQRCDESSPTFDPLGFLPRTSSTDPFAEPPTICTHSVIQRAIPGSTPPTWVLRIAVRDGGLLPTPTATPNQASPSMSKWPGNRAYQAWLGGRRTSPDLWDWMMGMPIGWSSSRPLATDRFQSWLHGLGDYLEKVMAPTIDEQLFDFMMGRTPDSQDQPSVEDQHAESFLQRDHCG